MGYPKNVKENTDFLDNYGPVEAKKPVSFAEELDSNLSASLMRNAATNGAFPTLAPFSQLQRGGSNRVVDSLDRIFEEGNTIPDSADAVYTKTIALPEDVDFSNVYGIFVNVLPPSPPVNIPANFAQTLQFFSLDNINVASKLIVFEDYRKTTASFALEASLNLPVPTAPFAVNASYQELIAANTVLIPSYSDNFAVIGTGEAGKSALLSAHFDKEARTLVFTFKKVGSTSSVSFTTGRFFNVIYLRA